MSGICGMLGLKGQQPDQEVLSRMTGTLRHRGPSDQGVAVIGPCGLGSTRISLSDDGGAGHMPMVASRHRSSSQDVARDEVWISYDGTVYNFAEIRSVLKATRQQFHSETDTETLLRAYIQFGEANFIKAFRGVFSLVIWDASAQRLTLMRDRLGVKPLFYTLTNDWLIFGSEIKALLEHPDTPRQLNDAILPHYLVYGYPPSPDTLFKEIYSLAPGYLLTVDLSGKAVNVAVSAYWQPPHPTSDVDPRPEDDIAADLLAHLRWSIRMRTGGDQPVGVFLDGGLNSAALVGLLSQESKGIIHTFTVGMDTPTFREDMKSARQVATRYVTQHHDEVVNPNLVDLLGEMVWHYDQPFGDASAVLSYLTSKLASQHVPVVMTGDGADELFAGGDVFSHMLMMQDYNNLPGVAKTAIEGALQLLPGAAGQTMIGQRANQVLASAALPFSERFLNWVRIVPTPWTISLAGRAAEQRVQTHFRDLFSMPDASDDPHIIAQLLSVSLRATLPDSTLVRADRMGMASSLEIRFPYLDHQLVHFAADIPSSLKIKKGMAKYILKQALNGVLPDRVIQRKTQTPSIPAGAWFQSELGDYARSVLIGGRAVERGLFAGDTVQRLFDSHLGGKADLGEPLWSLLTFEVWLRRYFN